MTHFRKPACSLAIALSFAFAGPVAMAQTAAPSGDPVERAGLSAVARMNMSVATYAFDYLGSFDGLVAPEQAMQLSLIAKMKVIALTCDGFDLDEGRYNTAMGNIMSGLLVSPEGGDPQAGSITLPFVVVMSAYSTMLGGNLAVAAYDPAGFCAVGDQLREQLAEDDASDLMIWADQD